MPDEPLTFAEVGREETLPPDSRPSPTADPLRGVPRFRTIPPKPCNDCPVITWGLAHDPDDQTKEATIRADATIQYRRTLNRTAARITQLEHELAAVRRQLAETRKGHA